MGFRPDPSIEQRELWEARKLSDQLRDQLRDPVMYDEKRLIREAAKKELTVDKWLGRLMDGYIKLALKVTTSNEGSVSRG